jgi:tetratricopeptide (TPR) repeat protein
MRKPPPALLFLLFSLLLIVPESRAQQRNTDIRFQLAQSYERAGDYESAVKIYEELYAKDSSNYVVFDALKRGYTQTKRYQKAVDLVDRMLVGQPKNVALLSDLGSLYNHLSDERAADSCWNRAIEVDPKTEMTYRIVANSMTQSRVFEPAIKVYLRGRAALGKPTSFASDLAFLYGVVLNYPGATDEYLTMLKQDPNQLGSIEGRISSFTGRMDGLNASTSEIENASKKSPDDLQLLQLLSWIYLEGKKFDQAFDVYKKIDALEKAGGNELFNFAERALRERAFDASAGAYQEVITKYPQFSQMTDAKFGYARCLEESSAAKDTLSLFGPHNPLTAHDDKNAVDQPFVGALAAYKGIVAAYPNTEVAARSLLRVAHISFDRFFNIDDANSALDEMEKHYNGFHPMILEARLLRGDVLLAKGDLDGAAKEYGSLATYRVVPGEYQEAAAFKLAEIDYFNGKFADATTKLTALSKNPNSDITNDALELMLFIQTNSQPSDTALKAYVHAELLQRRRKFDDAVAAYDDLAKVYPQSTLVDELLMNKGDALAQMRKFPDALAAYGKLQTDFPESSVLDKALIKSAMIYRSGLNDKQKAIESYQTLLVKFPGSIYCSEARQAIRELRGDIL